MHADALRESVVKFVEDTWCSKDKAELLMDLVKKERPRVCAEVGVFKGASFLPLAVAVQKNGSGIVYAIDAWSNLESVRGIPSHDSNYAWWKSLDMKPIRQEFLGLLESWKLHEVSIVLHMASRDAIRHLTLLDFLHLDGNFSRVGAWEDVMLFLPMLRSGGVVVLSNATRTIDGKLSKMRALEILYEKCDLEDVIDGHSTLVFRKR